jgi:hypothetical protein
VFYSRFLGNRAASVLVKFEESPDSENITRGDELDKHSIGTGLNVTMQASKSIDISLGYTLINSKNCMDNQLGASISVRF